MYLFTRRTRLAPGHGTAGVDWACCVAAKFRELTGQGVHLWGTAFSPAVGTIAWSGWFETLEMLERVGELLDADPAMEKLTNAGARYTEGGFDDRLAEPMYGTPALGVVRYVAEETAVTAGGNLERALAAGVERAQQSEAITGVPTLLVRSVTGPGGLHWITGYESAAAMEMAQRARANDPGWSRLPDASSRSTIYRRLDEIGSRQARTAVT